MTFWWRLSRRFCNMQACTLEREERRVFRKRTGNKGLHRARMRPRRYHIRCVMDSVDLPFVVGYFDLGVCTDESMMRYGSLRTARRSRAPRQCSDVERL